MDKEMEKIFTERMGELDGKMSEDKEYVYQSEQYHYWLEKTKKLLVENHADPGIIIKLDDAVGGYSSRYGEVMYQYAFHDGLAVGMEHKRYKENDGQREQALSFEIEDMENLIYIYDAFNTLCKQMMGTVIASPTESGIIGKLGRIHQIVEGKIRPDLKEGDDSIGYKILGDTTKTPKERAKILMG